MENFLASRGIKSPSVNNVIDIIIKGMRSVLRVDCDEKSLIKLLRETNTLNKIRLWNIFME